MRNRGCGGDPQVKPRTLSLYDHVGVQLRNLVPRFGLRAQEPQIRHAYEMLCRESLDMPVGRRPPAFSRISEDSTPFQYALILAPGRRTPLQFLGEAGIPGSSLIDRAALSRDRIDSLCKLLLAEEQAQQLSRLLDRIAPCNAFALENDHAGTFWIGVRFSSDVQPQLIVYINGKSENGVVRCRKAADFAAYLGAQDVWRGMERNIFDDMELLGFSLIVLPSGQITGRIYASSYGKSVSFYRRLFQTFDEPGAEELLSHFTEIMLGEDRQYPVRSAVFSVGLKEQSRPDFKLELCAHCIFRSDAEAFTSCSHWLKATGADSHLYQQLLQVILPQGFRSTGSHLHCFVGFGWKGQEPYTSIYLKPRILAAAG